MAYCITHQVDNVSIAGEKYGCVMAFCPPPELEEGWENHLTPPTPMELQAMELSARELEMDFS